MQSDQALNAPVGAVLGGNTPLYIILHGSADLQTAALAMTLEQSLSLLGRVASRKSRFLDIDIAFHPNTSIESSW